jgi:hypothetical protein
MAVRYRPASLNTQRPPRPPVSADAGEAISLLPVLGSMAAAPPPSFRPLTVDERRWLHDKYERLAEEEGNLAASRTSYFAAIASVLVTGLVVATADLLSVPLLLVLFSTFFALFGILIALVWAVLLHRTTDAQNLWRESARRLEMLAPPIDTSLLAPVSLRSGATLPIDLTRPYEAHAERFGPDHRISWQDRVTPSALTEVMPIALLAFWATAGVVVWVWFLFVR